MQWELDFFVQRIKWISAWGRANQKKLASIYQYADITNQILQDTVSEISTSVFGDKSPLL